MTIEILFVQGAGKDVHVQWDQKLVDSLQRELGTGYRIRYPEMPGEDDPHYPAWKAALLHELGALDDGAILVGHSIGGTMLLHALAAERPKLKLGAIVLIAVPFIGEGGWPSDELQPRSDFGLPDGVPVFLFHGTADTSVPLAHVELYAKAIPHAVVRTLADRDHQLGNDLSEVARAIESIRS